MINGTLACRDLMGARGGGVVLNVSSMVFLCSDEALFITGEALKVSGGHPLNF